MGETAQQIELAVGHDVAASDCDTCGHVRVLHVPGSGCAGEIPNHGACDCRGYRPKQVPRVEAPWWRSRMAALDLETTSPDPLQARIVQAAIAFVGGGEKTDTTAFLVDAGVEIPAEATAIHKITTEMVRATGEPIAKAVPYLLETIKLAMDARWPLVLMNAPYDLTVIDREARRLGLGGLLNLGMVLDVGVLDKQCDEYVGYHRKGSRKLVDLCFHYGARIEGAHDATHDAMAAARIAYRIGQRFPSIGNQSLENLQALQAAWYRDQKQGLNAHWIKKGDQRRVDNYSWPMRSLSNGGAP